MHSVDTSWDANAGTTVEGNQGNSIQSMRSWHKGITFKIKTKLVTELAPGTEF